MEESILKSRIDRGGASGSLSGKKLVGALGGRALCFRGSSHGCFGMTTLKRSQYKLGFSARIEYRN